MVTKYKIKLNVPIYKPLFYIPHLLTPITLPGAAELVPTTHDGSGRVPKRATLRFGA